MYACDVELSFIMTSVSFKKKVIYVTMENNTLFVLTWTFRNPNQAIS
jgi:hypothetical protein